MRRIFGNDGLTVSAGDLKKKEESKKNFFHKM